MYNTELKERFIKDFSTNTGRRHLATVMFNSLEPYEEAWNADFCTRSKDELTPVVSELVGFRTNSKRTRMSILNEYVRWCIKNNIDGACDELFLIEELGLDKLKRQMVANPQHLQRYLSCICDAESEETVDCIYRCFYWLAYSGMDDDEEALKVTVDEVSFEDMVIRHGGKEYPIYREAIPALKNCVKLTQFRYKHPNYAPDKVVYKERAEGSTLLRGITNDKSVKAMRVDMSRRAKNAKYKSISDTDDKSLDLKLSFYRVWLSGMFYRVCEAERAGMPVDFMDVASIMMEGKTYKLDSGRNLIGAKQRQLASDYLEDYNRWKEAYSI